MMKQPGGSKKLRLWGSRAPLLILVYVLFPAAALGQIGDYSSHSVTDTGLRIIAGSDTLVFGFYASDVVRVDFLPGGAQRPGSSYVLIRDPSPSVTFSVDDTGGSLRVETSDLAVTIAKYPVRVSYQDSQGRELVAEPAASGFTASGDLRRVSFRLPPDLHFYGTGERGTGIDLRGQNFSTYNSQYYGYSGPLETMNINIPFLATSSGYALYFESPIPATMDLGESDPGVFYYEIAGGELAYFLIIGSEVPEQIERYTWLTGRQPLPPKWALGYIQSKYGYRNRSEAESMVQTMRDKAIPADAIVLDLYWFWQMGDLAWNTSAFPDPAGMIGDFLTQGFKTIVITEPYFTQYCINYPFLTGAGSDFVGQAPWGGPYYLGGWWSCGCDAVLFDMTDPDAQAWLWERYEDFMTAGVAGLWTDLGEPERHPWDMEHSIGETPEVHNIYNLLWAKTMFEGFGGYRPDERIVNLTRSGYAGIQRYGVLTWSGDVSRSFGGLAVQPAIMLNMGLSGMSYHSSDLGGFAGWTSSELYSRWIEFGAFNPVMRAHGVDNQATEPWGFGAEAESIAARFIRLRYRLLPYIYALARENHEIGMPIVRPLFFLDPNDPTLTGKCDAYLFGPDLLVAPVVEHGQREKGVYLPEGYWVDYWTDSLYQGGSTVTVDAPLDRLPLFLRSGAIIPMQQVMDYVGAKEPDTLLLDVIPAFSGLRETFTLYEDDDESLDYRQGEYAKITLSQVLTGNAADTVLDLAVAAAQGGFPEMLATRTVLASVRLVQDSPDRVYLGVDSLASYPTKSELLQAGDGYFYDAGLRQLLVKFDHDVSLASAISIEGIHLPAGLPGPGGEPAEISLGQNHPNPFTHTTTISFTLGKAQRVNLEVFNLLGQRVITLLEADRPAGTHNVYWDGSATRGSASAPGIYFYRISTGKASRTRKMILVR
jgi:alpha-glucosidase (family GH31 glycosyl hydrolase)